jgi:hypothetical protein
MTRTENYRYTVDMKDGKPLGCGFSKVSTLREFVTFLNKKNGTTLYVKLQGRGPRKVNGRKYFKSLPLKYAVTADVYVYERHVYAVM